MRKYVKHMNQNKELIEIVKNGTYNKNSSV
uniref:Uncharacterized protein n=1 Tax=viral metagenome TaxID=1070528 RepID=A0A6C0JHI4_9ZZZZ